MPETQMALTDRVQPPACSRCGCPDAGFRVDLKAVCLGCVSWFEKNLLFNRELFR